LPIQKMLPLRPEGKGAGRGRAGRRSELEFLLGSIAVQNTIIDSISNRRVLRFEYDGQPRTVNPHALFRESEFQKTVLLGWQTDGGCNSRVPPCWGNFHLDKIVDLIVSDETFLGAQSGFSRQRFQHLIHGL
jgi:hypothetical protein